MLDYQTRLRCLICAALDGRKYGIEQPSDCLTSIFHLIRQLCHVGTFHDNSMSTLHSGYYRMPWVNGWREDIREFTGMWLTIAGNLSPMLFAKVI